MVSRIASAGLALLVMAGSAGAQPPVGPLTTNVTQSPSPTNGGMNCASTTTAPVGSLPSSTVAPLFAEYCAQANWGTDLSPIQNQWVHQLYVDGGLNPYVLQGVTCYGVSGGSACRGALPDAATRLLRTPGRHVVEVTVKRPNTDGSMAESPRSVAYQLDVTAQCQYAPPAGGATELRPVGDTLQGYNAIGVAGTNTGQAKRVQQLRAWGWRVEWQADFVSQKALLFADCVGTPQ